MNSMLYLTYYIYDHTSLNYTTILRLNRYHYIIILYMYITAATHTRPRVLDSPVLNMSTHGYSHLTRVFPPETIVLVEGEVLLDSLCVMSSPVGYRFKLQPSGSSQ